MPRKPNTSGDRYNDVFPTRLRALMKERRKTQDDLKTVLGVKTRQSVTGYIDGSTVPTIDKIIALSKYFNVSTDYLLGKTEAAVNDKDLQFICDYTGLSEKALANLLSCHYVGDHWFDESAVKSINALLSNDKFERLIFRLKTFLLLADRFRTALAIDVSYPTTSEATAIMDAEKEYRYFRFELIDSFTELVNDISSHSQIEKIANIALDNFDQHIQEMMEEENEVTDNADDET